MNKSAILIYVLGAVNAVLGLISAIGSTCPTLTPPTEGVLAIISTYQWMFFITTGLSYLAAIFWFVLLWAFYTGKDWFYKTAVLMAFLGAISGFIPAAIVISNGMAFSPSLMRAFAYLALLIVLILPPIKTSVDSQISGTTPDVGSVVNFASLMLFGVGLLLMILPFIMPATHLIGGIQYYDFAGIQFFGGLGAVLFASTLVSLNRLHPSLFANQLHMHRLVLEE
ncbi:MAG: hypothetical protein ACTSUB_04755 [Candidatus Thorarchaeota archaeon]